jgi:ankyrin repeat protein
LEASKINNVEDCELWLDKGGNPEFEKDGWNAVLWAACNGNELLLRTLHRRGALN